VGWSEWLVVGLFGIAFLAFGSSVYALAVTRVPVLRTPAELLPAIREGLALVEGQVLVDAGCGDGRTLVALCRGARVRGRGYELSGPMWLAAWVRVLASGSAGRIRIAWKDFLRCELEDADVVYCYLMPGAMQPVADKCAEEMAPGGRLVSFLWAVPDWEPDQVLLVGRLRDPVYIYRLPAKPKPVDAAMAAGERSQENDRQNSDPAPTSAGPKT